MLQSLDVKTLEQYKKNANIASTKLCAEQKADRARAIAERLLN